MLWMLLIEIFTSLNLFSFVTKQFKKIGIVQYVRQEGPQLHNYKEGTPTAGGIVFMVLFLAFYLISSIFVENKYLVAIILSSLLFGTIGFIDDFLSVRSKHSQGLSALNKLIMQLISGIVIYIILLLSGIIQSHTILLFNIQFNLGWFYPIFFVLYLTMFSNATNITDGLDGLSGGCALITAAGIQVFLWLSGVSDYSMMFLSGALLGFLWFNIKPASIFMGDTGALALGAIFGIIALVNGNVLTISLLSLIFFVEIFSVILQVSSFKITGKRLFKMSPIHHHFELLGWNETTVVVRFWIVNILGVVFSIVFVII
ncbi:MAG TPA: phospho-N-acetylmuramoyl-pentapeptide-transferase [Thermotogota bacterium]|nr:phospho-N-acetylmuramoyl-pentapeptide-transferase [Thermotogota bacterium]HRW33739.1 phospho-N-acetylmuramoyl-pentapeptide-transferase [Thermotogota bacterium]